MNFQITPQFTEKVFLKVGKLNKEDIDFYSLDTQVQFSRGFIDYLHKEANLTSEMALGVVEFLSDFGYKWLVKNDFFTKEAMKEAFDFGDSAIKAKDRIFGGIANLTKPIWEPTARESGLQAVKDNIGTYMGKAKDIAGQYGGQAWNYLKSPEFLNNVAPLLVGGLIGGLAPKAFGGGAAASGLGAAGGALLGKYVIDNKQELGNTGKVFLDNLRKQMAETFKSGPVDQAQSLLNR